MLWWDSGEKAAARDAARRMARTSLATAQSAAQEARDELAKLAKLAKLGEQRGELPWWQRRRIAKACRQTARAVAAIQAAWRPAGSDDTGPALERTPSRGDDQTETKPTDDAPARTLGTRRRGTKTLTVDDRANTTAPPKRPGEGGKLRGGHRPRVR